MVTLATLGAAAGAALVPATDDGDAAPTGSGGWHVERGPELPSALASNPVAAMTVGGRPHIYSVGGFGRGQMVATPVTRLIASESGKD